MNIATQKALFGPSSNLSEEQAFDELAENGVVWIEWCEKRDKEYAAWLTFKSNAKKEMQYETL